MAIRFGRFVNCSIGDSSACVSCKVGGLDSVAVTGGVCEVGAVICGGAEVSLVPGTVDGEIAADAVVGCCSAPVRLSL